MTKVVGILGCGWLGLPLAKLLISEGHQVNGSTTSAEKVLALQKEGINPFLIHLLESKIEGPISSFLGSLDVLMINVPPKLRGANSENYVAKMEKLHIAIRKSHLKKVIFISSTSVYGDTNGEVTEETKPWPSSESGRQLLLAEQIFQNDATLKTTIVRFGGLIGPTRHPITMLSGKQGLSNGNAPVNLIHLNDCIEIIQSVLKNDWWDVIFNAVYPLHPAKREYYSAEALKRGIPVPKYRDDGVEKGKTIHSFQLINVKKYIFKTSIVS